MGVWTFAEVTGRQVPQAHTVVRASGETCVSFFNLFSIALHGKFTGTVYSNSNNRAPGGFGFLNIKLGMVPEGSSVDSLEAVPNKGDVLMGMVVPNKRNKDKAQWMFNTWVPDMRPMYTFLMIISGGKMFGAKPPAMSRGEVKNKLRCNTSDKPDGLFALAMLIATRDVQMFVDDEERPPSLRQLNLGGQSPLEFACEAAMLLEDVDMKAALIEAAPFVEDEYLLPSNRRVDGEVLSNAVLAFHEEDTVGASLAATDSYTKYEAMVFPQLEDEELADAEFLKCRARKVQRRKNKAAKEARKEAEVQSLRDHIARLQQEIEGLRACAQPYQEEYNPSSPRFAPSSPTYAPPPDIDDFVPPPPVPPPPPSHPAPPAHDGGGWAGWAQFAVPTAPTAPAARGGHDDEEYAHGPASPTYVPSSPQGAPASNVVVEYGDL
jgi:hypothetical protein